MESGPSAARPGWAARLLHVSLAAAVAGALLAFPVRSALYGWGADLSTRGDHGPAFTLIRISALLGYSYGKSTLGAMYLSGEGTEVDGARAAYWLEQASRGGDAQAQGLLGAMYLFGRLVPKDRDKARYWLTRAAAGGDRGAAALLRSFYGSSRQ